MQGWVTDSHIVRCTSGKETWCAPSISDSCGKSFTGSSAWCKSSSVCCKISCSSFGFATGWKLDEIILNLHRVNWLLNKKSNNKRSVKCDFGDHSINPCSHQSVPLTPALSSWLWLGCQRFHHFHSHYSPVIPRSWYNTAWPVFSVNSSVGYLMQGLTADLVSIYPKDDSGTKIQGGKASQVQRSGSGVSQTQRVQPTESQRSEGMEFKFVTADECHPCQQKHTSKVLLLQQKMQTTRFTQSLLCHVLCGILTIPFQHP